MKDCEAIYDEQVYPLMTQIIEICQQNEMSLFASFKLNDSPLYCTTYVYDEADGEDSLHSRCRALINNTAAFTMTFTSSPHEELPSSLSEATKEDSPVLEER